MLKNKAHFNKITGVRCVKLRLSTNSFRLANQKGHMLALEIKFLFGVAYIYFYFILMEVIFLAENKESFGRITPTHKSYQQVPQNILLCLPLSGGDILILLVASVRDAFVLPP